MVPSRTAGLSRSSSSFLPLSTDWGKNSPSPWEDASNNLERPPFDFLRLSPSLHLPSTSAPLLAECNQASFPRSIRARLPERGSFFRASVPPPSTSLVDPSFRIPNPDLWTTEMKIPTSFTLSALAATTVASSDSPASVGVDPRQIVVDLPYVTQAADALIPDGVGSHATYLRISLRRRRTDCVCASNREMDISSSATLHTPRIRPGRDSRSPRSPVTYSPTCGRITL